MDHFEIPPAQSGTPSERHDRALDFARTAARAAVGLGLLVLLGDIILVYVTNESVRPPHLVWQSGLVLTTAGCWALAVVIVCWFAPWERIDGDVVLGALSLLAALVARVAASLPQVIGHETFYVVTLSLLFPGSLGALAACWWTWRRVRRMNRENPTG